MSGKLIIRILFAGVLAASAVAYHRELWSAVHFIFMRPYREFTDGELSQELEKVERKLWVAARTVSDLPSAPSSMKAADLEVMKQYKKGTRDLYQTREMILAELKWRRDKVRYLLLAGLLLSTLVFFETNRRILLYRDPSVRRRARFSRELEQKLAREREMKKKGEPPSEGKVQPEVPERKEGGALNKEQ